MLSFKEKFQLQARKKKKAQAKENYIPIKKLVSRKHICYLKTV